MIQPKAKYQPHVLYFSLLVLLFAGALLLRQEGPPDTAASSLMQQKPSRPAAPDFTSIESVDVRKQTFFDFLQPYIDVENRLIMAQREELIRLRDKLLAGIRLTRRERAYLSTVSEEYEIDTMERYTPEHVRQLLRRVDVIPSSLVLAQAANESAWGTSRFAVEGNNYFGQWCYSEGCGLVPERRRADASHEVRAFDNVAHSVHAYFMNINTHPGYQKLRRIRQRLRDQDKPLDSLTLAEGLEQYSERGDAYIEELRSMIDFNDLHERDSV